MEFLENYREYWRMVFLRGDTSMTSEAFKVDPHDVLWVTDAELIRRFGVPERTARAALMAIEYPRGQSI